MKDSMIEYVKKHCKKRDKNLKYDFMPELLEIIERPAHIGGKVIIWGTLVLMMAAILWASLAKVDVVVTTNGTVNPVGSVAVVQSLDNGIISEVCVKNGQKVNKGDVLIRLDSDETDIDISSIESEIKLLRSEIDIYQKVINGEDISGISVDSYDEELRNTMDYVISQEKYYQKSLSESTDNEDAKEQHRISLLGKIVDNEKEIRELQAQLDKVNDSAENETIKAGVSGCVTNLADGLTGSVVSAGTQLLTIVPDDTEMELCCYVNNSDISDMKAGRKAVIKLSAYPYSRYGTLEGEITYVSDSAISTDNYSNVYLVKLKIGESTDEIKLIPGLIATVEVKTGKRSVMDYFIEPITGALNDSLKEK